MKDSIDIESGNPKKKKSFLTGLTKHPILAGVLVGFIIFACVLSYISNKQLEVEQQKIQEEKTFQDEMFSEAHTKMQYFLEYTNSEESVESAARLIAHTMETGCSESYEILESTFDKDSMEYLQDYLKGRTCGSYSSPPIVRIEKDEHSYSYLVRLGSDSKRYVITVDFKDFKVSRFNITKYTEQNKIE